MAIDKAYVSGVIFGVTKKISDQFNRYFFTPEEHELAQKTVGQLYSCRPVDSIFSKEGVQKLQDIVMTGDDRGLLDLARKEIQISDQPWCVTYVIGAIKCLTACLPSIVYESTTAYVYGRL